MCGLCIDAGPNPEQNQPTGHTADMIFFKVAAKDDPDPKQFEELVRKECPQIFNGEEHSYISLGAVLNDQGYAMEVMGLGTILGLWALLTPRTVLPPGLDDDLIKKLAGAGLVVIKAS